jgi:hypothetical protein
MLSITHSSEINPHILQLIDVAQSKSGVASSLQQGESGTETGKDPWPRTQDRSWTF